MYFPTSTLLSLLSLTTLISSSPIDLPTSLRCHCLTFTSPSTTTPCQISGSQNLSWPDTRTFATSNNLQIQFASRSTVSRVLSSQKPVPTTLLMHAGKGENYENPFVAVPEAEAEVEAESRMVCGVDESVRRAWMKMGSVEGRKCDVSVLQIIMVVILLVIGYEALSTICSAIRTLFFRRQKSPIRLSGSEKSLTAVPEESSTSSHSTEIFSVQPESENKATTTRAAIPEAIAHLAQNTVEVHYRIAMPRGSV